MNEKRNASFDINSFLYDINKIDTGNFKTDDDDALYMEVLKTVQHEIAIKYSSELAAVLTDPNAESRLKSIINKIMVTKKLSTNMSSSETVDMIYNDMAGFKFLTSLIKDDPDIEEININGKNGIWVTNSEWTYRLDQKFENNVDCMSIIKKLSRLGGVILDGSKPFGDSFISRGVRMSGAIDPCVDPELGAIASIRKQKPSFITREKLIEGGTATSDELEFISLCMQHGISVANSGATGSGKTSLNAYFLSTIPYDMRIVSIEDTKEMDLLVVDERGFALNDVVQLVTLEGKVSQRDLVKLSLRLHPKVLMLAETRGEEALDVQEAARTGHTFLTSFHADNTIDGYNRLLTMCMMGETRLSEERLLKLIVKAFPIMLNTEQLSDGSRKIMEVFEATGVVNGEVQGNMLFEFDISENKRDENGKITRVIGKHNQKNGISDALKKKLIRKGCDENDINRLFKKGRSGRKKTDRKGGDRSAGNDDNEGN